jgi:hypothetical protein
MMSKKHNDARCAARLAQAQAQDLATSLQETRNEVVQLRARIDELVVIERKYLKYKEREPEIRHYLGNCAALAKLVNALRGDILLTLAGKTTS